MTSTASLRDAHRRVQPPTMLFEVVQHHRASQPHATAYTFQPGRGAAEQSWSWTDLDRRSRAIAVELQQAGMRGRPVLVLQPAGLEYVACFLGCLYAGAIAVPAYPPDGRRMGQSLARLAAIVADSRTTLAVTTSTVRDLALAERATMAPLGLAALTWLATDSLDDAAADNWQRPKGDAGQLALLQYTSGSTATPKGVMVSNANLLANLKAIHRRLGHDRSSGMVSWLPPFHDMGLIGGILSPLYGGFPAHLMAPEAFVAKPLRWLQTLSRTGASTSVAPNFGFEHCLRRISPEDKADLDLSRWRLALNGAEPIRAETLARFAAYFADCGFDQTALLPCYGLAEATLMVTGEQATRRPQVRTLDGAALSAGRASAAAAPGRGDIRIVSCGAPVDELEIRIVDPDRMEEVAANEVGEIWVSGPSVARGYWRRPEESARTFRAELEGTRGWLRTGDLGFMQDAQLHVVGRIKDLVILSGRNVYPQDVEQAVEACHPAIRSGAVAAFGIEVAGAEQLVVAAELDTGQLADSGSVLAAVRASLAARHEVSPHAVVLIRRSTLPKTTSGKLQRQSCRSAFLQLQLDVIAASVLAEPAGGSGQPVTGQLLVATISEVLGRSIGLAELRTAQSLAELSIDYPCVLRTISALGPRLRADFEPSELLRARSGGELLTCFGVNDETSTSGVGQPQLRTESADALEDWLRSAVARRLAVPMDSVSVDIPMRDLGLDSKNSVAIADELSARLGRPVPTALVFDHPTIRALATALTDGEPARPASSPAQPAPISERSSGSIGRPGYRPGSSDQIAIVGIGCRLPGASDVRAYWQLLRDGREGIGPVPASRWDPAVAGTPSRGGFLDDPAAFDAMLFGISRREADFIDPQQRLMLEVCWQALEDAGIPVTDLRGTDTGVYVGISSSDYAELSADGSASDLHAATGNAHALAANRISYTLDLRGPSLAVDTACSSSLVAVHLAVRGLQAGECSFALAGGVNLTLTPGLSAAFAQAGMLAPDGACRAFDEDAAGYVRGEGAAVVCLKRLEDAIAAGDRVYGVIRGSAVGHGGRANGITAPSSVSQERVIRAALANAGLEPATVNYVEAHGTGTSLGDPIEWESLARVYGAEDRPVPCTVGSVKPTIGHLEAAAGIAGLVKAALVLHHGTVPAQRNFRSLNPRMTASPVPLAIAVRPSALPDKSRVAVSSFGFGGANAHLVLDAAPAQPIEDCAIGNNRTAHALALSGHTPSALATLAQRWRQRLADDSAALADLCATNNAGRVHLAHRAVLIAADRAELDAGLASLATAEGVPAETAPTEAGAVCGTVDSAARIPRVAMLFSGQGSQYPGMGKDLYEGHKGFAASLDHSDSILRPLLGRSLLDLILRSDDADALRRTRFCQPALVAFEIALLQLWTSLGIRPAAVCGHSVGAFTAAHAAGVLQVEDALTLAAIRGRLMDEQPGDGAMLACSGDELRIRAVTSAVPELVVAVENGPGRLVLAGRRELIDQAAVELAKAGVACRPLQVSHAFHSPMMAGAADGLRSATRAVKYQKSSICWVSDTTGEPVIEPDAEYWVTHLLRPVRFGAAIRTLAATCDTFLEVGPHATLLSQGRASATVDGGPSQWLPSLRRGADDWRVLLHTLAELHVAGAPVDWSGLHEDHRRGWVSVPHTVLEPTRHWVGSAGQPSTPPTDTTPMQQRPLLDGADNHQASPADSVHEVADVVLRQVARISGFDPARLETRHRLGSDLGFDSLMRTELHRALVAAIPMLDEPLRRSLPEDPTIGEIVRVVSAGRPDLPGDHLARTSPGAAAGQERVAPDVPAAPSVATKSPQPPAAPVPREVTFTDWAEYRALQQRLELASSSGTNPYGRVHEGFNSATATVNGQRTLNFAAFNYLGLSHHPRLLAAASAAIAKYGTSSSATPLLCGETPLHHELDRELADFLGVEAAIVFAGGHATNVATVGHLFGPDDLIVHDAWIHDSSVRGAILSGARRRPFPHNDWQALDSLLSSARDRYRRVLIVIEGAYSQDGDLPDLPAFIEVKRRHEAMLMVDEAHSIGVLGATGRGIGEHFAVDRADVDLWMGTISKALGSLGGYIAASREIVEYLKFTTPLYIFSTGTSPANAAAALEAVRLIRDEPERVRRLQALSEYFRHSARRRGLDIGVSRDSAVIPVILGDWDRAMQVSNRLLARGINVMPIGYPAVDPDACRLRFFVNVDHSEADLDHALDELGTAMTEQSTSSEPATENNSADAAPVASRSRSRSSVGEADVLLTGASGFIGGHLARALVSHGYRVRALVRPTTDLSALAGVPVQPAVGDVTDPATLDAALDGVRHVYHCAGMSADWGRWQDFQSINVDGSKHLAEAAHRAGSVERFIHVSTTDVFGYPVVPCDENGPLTDVGLPYNKSKLLGERAVREVAERTGLPITVIRPVSVYGPRSKDFVVEIATLLLKNQMMLIGGGAVPAGLIYIDNLTDAMIAACESEAAAGQCYNLRDDASTTWRDYICALADGIGAKPPSLNLPSPVALGIARASETVWGALRLKSRPLLTRHAVRLFQRDQSYGIDEANRDFGFKSRVGFAEGMRMTVEWLHSDAGRAAVPAMPNRPGR